MSQNANPSRLDQQQIFQRAFDESTDCLRVNSTVTLDAGQMDIVLSHTDDSIKIGDGTDFLAINSDGSLNVILTSSEQAINVDFPSDATLGTIESGEVATVFNEITSIASGSETTIVTYTATQPTRMKIVEVSGTTVAEYTIYLNGVAIHKKRTSFSNFDNSFQFSKGYNLLTNNIITIKVLHTQNTVADFSAFLLVLKD